MNFKNIPEEVLDTELYEDWDLETVDTVTLRTELVREFKNEDLEDVDLKLGEDGSLWGLTAYSKTYVGTLVIGTFGDMQMITLKRNP